jgi:hypothetical protein
VLQLCEVEEVTARFEDEGLTARCEVDGLKAYRKGRPQVGSLILIRTCRFCGIAEIKKWYLRQ